MIGLLTDVPTTSETSRQERMFPTLTCEQVERIAAHGRCRDVAEGEILAEAGEQITRFFVVVSGRLDIMRPVVGGESPVVVHRSGQFTGEVNMLSGRRSFVRVRAGEP